MMKSKTLRGYIGDKSQIEILYLGVVNIMVL